MQVRIRPRAIIYTILVGIYFVAGYFLADWVRGARVRPIEVDRPTAPVRSTETIRREILPATRQELAGGHLAGGSSSLVDTSPAACPADSALTPVGCNRSTGAGF